MVQTDQTLDTRLADIAANQCAGLCYTSGTTGNPKVEAGTDTSCHITHIMCQGSMLYILYHVSGHHALYIMCQGTMLSHDNIVFAAREFSKLNLWRDGEERIVTYLPLSHIAGKASRHNHDT